jgi:hypothetical protein
MPEKTSITQDIRQAIKDGLVKVGDEVKQNLITAGLAEEKAKRTKAAASVLEKIEAAELEIRKIKPAYIGYTPTGDPVGEPIFTKEQSESLKKSNEQLAKLTAALTKALTDHDFSKVLELSKN